MNLRVSGKPRTSQEPQSPFRSLFMDTFFFINMHPRTRFRNIFKNQETQEQWIHFFRNSTRNLETFRQPRNHRGNLGSFVGTHSAVMKQSGVPGSFLVTKKAFSGIQESIQELFRSPKTTQDHFQEPRQELILKPRQKPRKLFYFFLLLVKQKLFLETEYKRKSTWDYCSFEICTCCSSYLVIQELQELRNDSVLLE